MTTGVAGWVVVLSEAQQAQQEGCKMINTRREGLSRRQGYPRLCSALRMYMRRKIHFENSGVVILHQITKTEGKKAHRLFLHQHSQTRLCPSVTAVRFAPRIVESWVSRWPTRGDPDLNHVCRKWVTDSWDCGKVTPAGRRAMALFATSEEKQLDLSSSVIAVNICTEMCGTWLRFAQL